MLQLTSSLPFLQWPLPSTAVLVVVNAAPVTGGAADAVGSAVSEAPKRPAETRIVWSARLAYIGTSRGLALLLRAFGVSVGAVGSRWLPTSKECVCSATQGEPGWSQPEKTSGGWTPACSSGSNQSTADAPQHPEQSETAACASAHDSSVET